ncbi:hypothetical protein DRP07_00120 [Archaeoglobales archaeon]|nr:MAG: hypothetical protein DRP07_00120 [Archaeoglobales archaeon]
MISIRRKNKLILFGQPCTKCPMYEECIKKDESELVREAESKIAACIVAYYLFNPSTDEFLIVDTKEELAKYIDRRLGKIILVDGKLVAAEYVRTPSLFGITRNKKKIEFDISDSFESITEWNRSILDLVREIKRMGIRKILEMDYRGLIDLIWRRLDGWVK